MLVFLNKSVCKKCHNNKKLKNNCKILLNESLESYYWLGFIDGDGCISNQPGRKVLRISIRVHSSWLFNMKYMFNRGYICNDGYCTLTIGKMSEIIDYKNFIISNTLPALKRKWDKV